MGAVNQLVLVIEEERAHLLATLSGRPNSGKGSSKSSQSSICLPATREMTGGGRRAWKTWSKSGRTGALEGQPLSYHNTSAGRLPFKLKAVGIPGRAAWQTATRDGHRVFEGWTTNHTTFP